MRELISEIYCRDKVLAIAGWMQMLLLVVMLCAAPFDSRTVTGLNAWIKPIKFAASIGLYIWTLAWFITYVPKPRWGVQLIRWGVAIVMTIEMACIVLQAARGTTSHYNVTTSFDAQVFQIMGIMIVINSLLVLMLLILFFIQGTGIPRVYLWGIRLGLFLFLFAGAEGGIMIAKKAHTVGMADGGAGLPLVNWSTQGGDLRIAHALGLHALQLLPLAGYGISVWRGNVSQIRRVAYLWALTLIYVGITMLLFWQAMRGRPLIAFV
ncbi:MAG: hypothetical protein M3R15_06415 [Acidobacteriota bacterium]|nr:hypothetical protein [Acidobacteriota bacterium]